MLIFYTSDLSLIDGYNIFRAPAEAPSPLDVSTIETTNWQEENVNIQCEFGNAGEGKRSIHDYIELKLEESDSNIAYYDHGTDKKQIDP